MSGVFFGRWMGDEWAMKGDEKAMKGVDGWFRDVVETQNFASLHPGENIIYSWILSETKTLSDLSIFLLV